ncbi:MAG: LCP family protein, partial [Oscillospiraceae bacterium]|nr:LCP family protein [Oscillospiraceae bacterium]
GYYGCGEEGMAALLDLVEDCVGFRPDGYVLIDWDGFAELVDLMGGVEFEVPMDMEVDGIALEAGMQHLDGHEALTVARFRKGYSLADLQRIEVQRQLIDAALDQWVTAENILKLPSMIECVNEATLTDLNVLNILWLARDLKVCDAGMNVTLPGAAQMIGDGSYYVLDPQAVADTVNAGFNPYTKDITTDDLYIKIG